MAEDCLPCQQQTVSVGFTTNGQLGGTQSISHGTCEGVTIDLLKMFHLLIKCVITHGVYDQVQTTENEINTFDNILTNWIAAKEVDPATCEFQEKLPLIQAIINRIVVFGRC